MKSYRIITISNRQPTAWYFLQEQFYKSLGDYKVDTLVPQYWGGLMTKPRTLFQYIEQGNVTEEYIIFPDNWDVVFAATPDEIMTRFHSFYSDVVISAEANCFPDDLRNDYDKLDNQGMPYKYLNSGFIVGKTSAIFECLKAMDLPSIPDDYYDNEKGCNVHPNDQFEWQKIFLKQPVSIALDRHQILCQTLHDAKPEQFDFSSERIKNVITDSYPCSFHYNGASKDFMPIRVPILKKLNLLDPNEENRDLYESYMGNQ